MVSVLISSAGRRTELINCFREGARELGAPMRIVATDANPKWSVACHCADAQHAVPPCRDKDFIPAVLEICKAEGVKLVVPTIDTELGAFAEARGLFEEIGVTVNVSSPAVVRIARNKGETAEFLRRHQIPTPKTGAPEAVLREPDLWRWPMVLKPAGGSSSIGLRIVNGPDEMEGAYLKRTDFIAQELWKGREFTVNVFFDRDGVLRCSVPHWRREVRGGEVSKGVTWRHEGLMTIAAKLGSALSGARGALCFQAIVAESEEMVVFEINARFGGGYPLAHRAGATFSKWLLEEALGRPCSASDAWKDRLVMLRYDASVFAPAIRV